MATLIPPAGSFLPSIEYTEILGSPKESYNGQQGKVQRQFLVDWDDRWNFCLSLLGYSEPGGTSSKDGFSTCKWVKRFPPYPYNIPQLVGAVSLVGDYWMYATSIDSIEGKGIYRPDAGTEGIVLNGVPQAIVKDEDFDSWEYDRALITASFETLTYRVRTDDDMRTLHFTEDNTGTGNPDEYTLGRYITRHIQPIAEHLTLPFGGFLWSPSEIAANGASKIISSAELQYTWHGVPAVPSKAQEIIGCVNSQPLIDRTPGNAETTAEAPTAGRTYPAGTLLLLAMEVKPYRFIGGFFACDIVYRMKYFEALDEDGNKYDPARGHNYFLKFQKNSSTPKYTYERLNTSWSNATTPNGRDVYDSKDFAALFLL